MTVWFTVQLDDRPGSLARVATALGERGVNITGIVGVAEDTDGALMLTTSDATKTREAFGALGLDFEERRLGVRARLEALRAAGDELAAAREIVDVRDGARDDRQARRGVAAATLSAS